MAIWASLSVQKISQSRSSSRGPPLSRRSLGSHRPRFGLASPAHRPAATSLRSLRAYVSSSALRSFLIPKNIGQVGPLQWGRISFAILVRSAGRILADNDGNCPTIEQVIDFIFCGRSRSEDIFDRRLLIHLLWNIRIAIVEHP